MPHPVTSLDAPARATRRDGLRRAGLAALVAAGVVVAAVAADAAVLVHRMPTVAVDPSGSGDGTAYLLLASDSRERLTGADRQRYADAAQAEGERADLVLLLRRTAAGRAELLSIPRDLYVGAGGDHPHRLGLALEGGAQAMVDSLCGNLGVGVDHVAVLDFRGLVDLVDAAGGVTVKTAGPLRDRRARLALDSAGVHHLDGSQALAWVRSRHPEVLVDGRWRRPADADPTRTRHAVEVLGQAADRLDSPLTVQRALWRAGPRVRRDDGLGPRGLAALALGLRSALESGRVSTVPVELTETEVPVAFPTSETDEALEPFRTPGCDGAL